MSSKVQSSHPAARNAQKSPPGVKDALKGMHPAQRAAILSKQSAPPPKAPEPKKGRSPKAAVPVETAEASKKKTGKKVSTEGSFGAYIKKVLKEECKTLQLDDAKVLNLSGHASCVLAGISQTIAKQISSHARSVCSANNRTTVALKDIAFGTSVVFSDPELREIVMQNIKHTKGDKKANQTPARREKQLGMHFSVMLSEKHIRAFYTSRLSVSADASPALARVLENFTRYLLKSSIQQVLERGKVTMQPKHIFVAVESNGKLKQVFTDNNFAIYGVGVMPGIDESLIPSKEEKAKQQKRRKKAAKEKAKTDGPSTDGKKVKRNLPGVKAIKDIKLSQSKVGLLIRKGPFESVVRKFIIPQVIAQLDSIETSASYHFSDDIIAVIQQFVEDKVIVLLKKAQRLAIYSKRVGISGKDIRLAWEICEGNKYIPVLTHELVQSTDDSTIDMMTINSCGIDALATRAAVVRKGHSIHDEVRRYIQSLLMVILGYAVLNVSLRKAVTISDPDIRFAFERLGVHYFFYRTKKTKKTKKVVQDTPVTAD